MKKMYKGKVNSPATLLVETIDSSVTSIKVADGTVFPEGPNVAVIGTDGNAETIKYDSINGNILVGCVRGFQGKASVWDKDTIIARNFTEYDLDALQENILELDKKQLKDFQEDENHRTVTDSEKEKWDDKVSQSQITGDVSATGSDKVFSVDFIKKHFEEFDKVKFDKSNITDSYYGVNSSLVLSQKGAYELSEKLQQMVISNINFLNGNIPKKLSQLTNDKNFKTEKEIQELINNSTKLKKEVVTSLPTTGKEDVIYLLKNKNDTNNYYTEYMWISGRWEIIGDTKVDLTGYLKTTDLKNAKLRTNKNSIHVFTDRSKSETDLDIILGDLELRTEQNKKNIKTKLSQLSEDENHKTVTDSEKQTWNKKFELPQGKENQVLTKTTNGAEFKNISSSRSATFIIANYDSSENSKAGADYVIRENESPCDVINSFIAKLPNYGGKIQFTEGNFIEKNDKSINLNKDNITLSGYGESTNLKRTIENAKIEFIKIFNSNIILEDLQSNSKYENAVWFSENATKCKLFNIAGTSPTVAFYVDGSNHQLSNCSGTSSTMSAFNIHGSNHSLSNCSGASTGGQAFYINSSNNQLSNCSGTSTGGQAFYIDGSNHSLSNCSGASTGGQAFYINSSNNQLSNCSGTSTGGSAFQINGSGNSLIGCIGETKNPNKYSFLFSSNSKSCIVLGNFYHAGGLNNKGTNNVLANNIKLEV